MWGQPPSAVRRAKPASRASIGPRRLMRIIEVQRRNQRVIVRGNRVVVLAQACDVASLAIARASSAVRP